MNDKFIKTGLCLASLLFFCSIFLSAAEYSIIVETKYGFNFTGDVNGGVTAKSVMTYVIGPYSQPITVTLTVPKTSIWLAGSCGYLTCWDEYDIFKGWMIEGITQTGSSITLTADDSAPSVSIAELWELRHVDSIPPEVPSGDANNDGDTTIIDALMIAQYTVGLNPANFNITEVDVNCDGVISIIDAYIVAQYCVGIISAFYC